METLIYLLITAVTFVISAKLMKNVQIRTFWSAIWIAAVLGILNATIGAVLGFIMTPVTWITLGLFSFVIDGLMIWLASKMLSGFYVKSFGTAFILAFVVTAVECLIRAVTSF